MDKLVEMFHELIISANKITPLGIIALSLVLALLLVLVLGELIFMLK